MSHIQSSGKENLKVLFISSGNSNSGISPIVINQGDSLKRAGITIDYYTISGKGPLSYLKNIIPLRKKINAGKYDLLHAHYSFSAFVTTLTFSKPLVVSLLGSDVYKGELMNLLIKFLARFFWAKCIVKSAQMTEILDFNSAAVVPNGVNLDKFRPFDQMQCKTELKWDISKKHILFAANPSRPEKNFPLAEKAVSLINDLNCELHCFIDIPNDKIARYYNAADVVILTSSREGSPNVIKEAMACNRPVVATNVGDIRSLLENVPGCFCTESSPQEIADAIRSALAFNSATIGRTKLLEMGLDDLTVADSLINIYNKAQRNE